MLQVRNCGSEASQRCHDPGVLQVGIVAQVLQVGATAPGLPVSTMAQVLRLALQACQVNTTVPTSCTHHLGSFSLALLLKLK